MSSSFRAGLALAAVAGVLVGAPGASAATSVDSSALRGAVTVDGVKTHLRAVPRFADQSDGTREASTPGYTASADYVGAHGGGRL